MLGRHEEVGASASGSPLETFLILTQSGSATLTKAGPGSLIGDTSVSEADADPAQSSPNDESCAVHVRENVPQIKTIGE